MSYIKTSLTRKIEVFLRLVAQNETITDASSKSGLSLFQAKVALKSKFTN